MVKEKCQFDNQWHPTSVFGIVVKSDLYCLGWYLFLPFISSSVSLAAMWA
jgi:hypothetical protein